MSVLGNMDHDGQTQPRVRFAAEAMYCQFFADDAGTNAFSFSDAFGALHVRVPFLVVEESMT